MYLACVGLSHHTAPLEIRELATYPEAEIREHCQQLASLPSLREGFLISTCNRTELYAVSENPVAVISELRGFLERTRPLGAEVLANHLFEHQGPDAVDHLFRVAASLDSMVMGEPQILGQVKSAYAAAKEAGTAGPILSRCLEKAFLTAKRVRTDTGIARSAVSVASVAVELARKILGELPSRQALLVGAGEMGEIAAQHLHQGGVRRIVVANRSLERARTIAANFDGEGYSLDRLESLLVEVDVVISSTAATDFIIRQDTMRRVIKARRHRSIVLIDIAVPRDIDPTCNNVDNVYVYDLDDLQKVVLANLSTRQAEARSAERIIDEHAARFQDWLERQRVVPTIRALRERYMTMARNEAKRTSLDLGIQDPAVERKLVQLAETVANKILHNPTVALKRNKPDEGVEAARMLFDLEGGANGESAPSLSPTPAPAPAPDGDGGSKPAVADGSLATRATGE